MAEVITQCDCGQLPGLDSVQLRRNEIFDPDVICTLCGERLCTAEDGDTLAVLVAVANDHVCDPEARGCDACGAEAGEECRPMCIGLAAELDRIEEEGCSCCQARSLAGQAYHECARCGHLGKSHVTCNKPIPGTESSAAPQ